MLYEKEKFLIEVDKLKNRNVCLLISSYEHINIYIDFKFYIKMFLRRVQILLQFYKILWMIFIRMLCQILRKRV